MLCNKVPFVTEAEARDHMRKWSKKALNKLPKRVYHCKLCDNWHITSQTKQQFKHARL